MTVERPPAASAWPQSGGKLQPGGRAQLGELIKQSRARRVTIGSPHATYRWDLSRLDKVVAFHPPDMIMTAETGLTLNAVKDLAEAEKLWLPLDTTGGDLSLAEYLAGDLSLSWLSHRYGTARDWIVGLTALDDQGREVTSGARVKNVAGYQLAPLYVGAGDALGPIVEVSFRLLPLPVPVTVARWQADDPIPLVTLWQQSRRSSHPSGRGEPWEAFRLEHRDGQWRLDGLTRFPLEAAAAWEGPINGCSREAITETDTPPREGQGDILPSTIRIQVLPTRIPELLASLHSLGPDLTCYPAAGAVHVGRLDGIKDRPALESLLTAVAEKRGRVQPLTADVPVKLPTPASPPADRDLMAQVKRILDPDGVFGPLPVELY